MPELPEVQVIADTLRSELLGRRIVKLTVRRQDVMNPPETDWNRLLTGKTIIDVTRRAKRVVFTLSDSCKFYVHLGMSGQLLLAGRSDLHLKHTHVTLWLDRMEWHPTRNPRPKDPRRRRPSNVELRPEVEPFEPPTPARPTVPSEQHGDVRTPDELRFVDPRRFGGWFFISPANEAADNARLGPEPLNLSPRELGVRLARTRRAVKTALLDQSLIVGIGNIYADESLFAAGINPCVPANRLSDEQVVRLCHQIKRILRQAILAGGSTLRDYRNARGGVGAFQAHHRVYARTGQPCRRCKTRILRTNLQGRSTHFCPNCQSPKLG